VFGYVPPAQDFNPEHPATRPDSMRLRAAGLPMPPCETTGAGRCYRENEAACVPQGISAQSAVDGPTSDTVYYGFIPLRSNSCIPTRVPLAMAFPARSGPRTGWIAEPDVGWKENSE